MGASGDEKGDVGEDRDYFNPKSDYKTPFDSSTIVGSPGYEAEAPGDGVVHEMHTSEIHEMLGGTYKERSR